MKTIERVLWVAGLILVAVALFGWARGAVLSRRDVSNFEQARAMDAARKATETVVAPSPEAQPTFGPSVTPDELAAADASVDTDLWSPKRVNEYEESLEVDTGLPLGLLRIPKIDLVVPIFEGTSDLVLNRGLGRIVGTSRISEAGNIGLAGHRDGFFRGLKDIGPGDFIELQSMYGDESFVVESIQIVTPDQVEVLRQSDEDVITLVTCYPFYFVGSAPKRYIVRAVRTS